ncbi:MAG: hypothetical protein JWP35_367 [Caulobacter sp.]|nr:hypothetical protein [Caulobacter sp.]
MLLPILAAAATLVLSERPPELVKAGGAQAYAVWLRGQVLDTDAHFTGKGVCADAKVSEAEPPHIEVLRPPNGKAGALVLERLAFSGCGHGWLINIAVGTTGGGWSAAPMLPGESQAGFLLQNDVLKTLVPAVRKVSAGCNRLDWSEVKLTTPPNKAGVWAEAWSINACGRPVNLTLTFTPGANGGTDYAVKSR